MKNVNVNMNMEPSRTNVRRRERDLVLIPDNTQLISVSVSHWIQSNLLFAPCQDI